MRKGFAVVLILAVFAISGCSSLEKDKAFSPVVEIPLNKGILYIYRNDTDSLDGFTFFNYLVFGHTVHTIEANGKPITIMECGGYFPYIVDPGELTLNAKVRFKMFVTGLGDMALSENKSIKVRIDSGKAHYVRAVTATSKEWFELDYSQKLNFTSVRPETGDREIQGTRLLDPY